MDNDGDTVIDSQDPGCVGNQDDDEHNICPVATQTSTCHCAVNTDCTAPDTCQGGYCRPQGADLSVSKTGPSSVTRGSTVSYTVVATNAGPATATNVVIADVIPAGLAFDAGNSSAGCVVSGNNVLCNNFSLTAGQSRTFTIAFAVPGTATCNSTIQNTATVSNSATDPNSANNTSQTVSTTVNCPLPQADLSVSKTQIAPSVVMPGSVIVYRLTALNAGPDTATNVVVADVIPSGLTFNDGQSDDACIVNGNSVLCNNFSLGSGQSRSFIFAFTVPGPATCGSSIANTATVSTSAVDPNSANNTSQTVTTGVQCPFSDLSIVKSGVATINRGSTLLYTITVTNLGIAQANNVVVTDRPNPMTGLVFDAQQSDSNCVVSGNNVLCITFSLTAGQSRTFTIAFAVPGTATCNSTIQNTATVSNSATDPNSANNTSQTVSTTVNCPLPQADLSVSKTQIAPSVVMPGSVIVYRLTALNAGPDTATNVVVADVIPSGLTFNDGQSDDACIVNGNSVLCNNFSLGSGQSRSFIFAFTVPGPATCGSSIANTATVSTSAVDPNSANNTSQTVTTGVQCPFSDLSIVKSGVATINRGSTLLYTITVTNLGIAQANNVVVTDRPNPMTGLVFDAQQSDSNCVLNGIEVLCNNVNLVGGASRTYTIAFTVSSAVACDSTILNVATVSTSTPDSNEQNNTSQTVSTTVNCPLPQADLSVSKTQIAPSVVMPGSVIVYRLTALNAGPDTATNVVVADVIPSGLTFNDGQSDDACIVNGNSVLCNNFSLGSGQSRSFIVAFNVPGTATCGRSIANTATVSTSAVDPNSANNTSQTVTTGVQCPFSDLSIVKSGVATINRGSTLLYTITVTNLGIAQANNVVVTDRPNPMTGLVFDAQQSDSNCVLNGIEVLCNNVNLVGGASRTYTIAFTVSSAVACDSTILNVATVSTSTPDSNEQNNTSQTVSTTVNCPLPQADLSVSKTQIAPSVVMPG